MSITGSHTFKIENSTLTNVHGNATIFRFDGDGSLTEEFKSVLLRHMIGSVTVRDIDKEEKRTLSQSIFNIPRASAAYNDYALKNRKHVSCFEGTRCSLLLEIAVWVLDPKGSLFYVLFGIAGVGKSTIAQTFAEKADVLRLLGASFFFSRDEADRKNAAKFFTTLAFQLCLFDECFAQAIGQVLRQGQGIAAISRDPHEQLDELILGPLRGIVKPDHLPILIIVDALDECDKGDRAAIVAGLNRLVQELPSFKVFLTTRPHPHLEAMFDGERANTVFRLENIEKKVVDSDIGVYLKYLLSPEQVELRLPKLREEWSASDNEIEYLVQAAGQLFIVASTSVHFILDPNARTPGFRMKKLLDTSGQGRTPLKALNDFYTVILRCAVPEDCAEDILENYQAVVGTIVTIQNPLPIDALAELIDESKERISSVLDNLQSVFSLGMDDIPLIRHKSFFDYVTDPVCCRHDDLRITLKDHHTRMAICCLRVMNRCLKRNIMDLGVPARYLNNDEALFERRSYDKISADLQYACIYWVAHIKNAEIKNVDLMDELKKFADKHLTHWFEALSWMGQLDKAPGTLTIVRGLLPLTSSDMSATFYDAFRMVSMSFEHICLSAHHVYHSALPFVPTKALLREKYKKEMTHEVVGGHEEWGPEIVTLRGDSHLDHIRFSSDSSQLAAWDRDLGLFSDSLGHLTVWDATSGIFIATHSADSVELADNFSVVLSSGEDKDSLYNLRSKALIETFRHCTDVTVRALSFDGSRLATRSKDGTISLWDVREKEVIASVPRLEEELSDGWDVIHQWDRLAFAPTLGDLLASVSYQDVILLNATNGKVICRLNHESSVRQFSFLRDDSRLATLDSQTLRVWDTEDGKYIPGDFGASDEFIISADGSSLATFGDKQVKLWSGDRLSCISTFDLGKDIVCLAFSKELLAVGFSKTVELYDIQGHSAIAVFKVYSTKFLVISPDSTRLAGATSGVESDGLSDRSASYSIHLWDASSIKSLSVPGSSKQAEVTTLAFSPDCSRLASGFDDGTVQLWDTTCTARIVSTRKRDSASIAGLAFSPEGDRFASRMREGINSRVWDGKEGSLITSFTPLVFDQWGVDSPLAMSRDLLAVGAQNEIHIWNHMTSSAVRTLDGGSSSLSFSLDGSLLASAHQSSSVTLWDVAKGTRIFRHDVRVHDDVSDVPPVPLESGGTLMFSPDAYKLAVRFEPWGEFMLIDMASGELNKHPGCEDISWVPEPWISNPVTYISRRLPQSNRSVEVLQLPGNVAVSSFAEGLSGIIALGCSDSRVFIVRLSPLIAASEDISVHRRQCICELESASDDAARVHHLFLPWRTTIRFFYHVVEILLFLPRYFYLFSRRLFEAEGITAWRSFGTYRAR